MTGIALREHPSPISGPPETGPIANTPGAKREPRFDRSAISTPTSPPPPNFTTTFTLASFVAHDWEKSIAFRYLSNIFITANQRASTTPSTHASTNAPSKTPRPARGQRPAPLSRRSTGQGIVKLGLGRGKGDSNRTDSRAGAEEDGLTATFLQYCTTCEKQIQVPNSSILYCSESCRKADSSASAPSTAPQTPHISALASLHLDDVPTKPSRDVIQPASPTARDTHRALKYAHEPIEEPEVWPVTPSKRLSYQAVPSSSQSNGIAPLTSIRHSTSSAMIASSSSPTTSRTSPPQYPQPSPPLSSSYRPLPPRHKPNSYSASFRSIDLVTPFAIDPSSTTTTGLTSVPSGLANTRSSTTQSHRDPKRCTSDTRLTNGSNGHVPPQAVTSTSYNTSGLHMRSYGARRANAEATRMYANEAAGRAKG
ncbi:MAG: hypothetical protein M1817_001240 [Caeruleum heppii]|nr:MAG: hypothetical protein M1817_001240 [Caeruleum heppii]